MRHIDSEITSVEQSSLASARLYSVSETSPRYMDHQEANGYLSQATQYKPARNPVFICDSQTPLYRQVTRY